MVDEYYSPNGFIHLSKKIGVPLVDYYSSLLKKCIYGQNNLNPYVGFTGAISFSSYMALIDAISSYISTGIINKIVEVQVHNLVEIVVNYFLKKREKPKQINYSKDGLHMILLEFDFKSQFIKYLDNLGLQILEEIIDALGKSTNNNLTQLFLRSQLEALFKEVSKGNYVNMIPSQDDHGRKLLFDSLFEELLKPAMTRFGVYFLIGNMDCHDYIYNIGDVIFYDARKWDFGEYHTLDSFDPILELGEPFKSNFVTYATYKNENNVEEYRRNSARAFIEVYAKDPLSAKYKASVEISQALDVLVYTSVQTKESSGFRPQLSIFYQVVDLENKKIGSKMKYLFHSEMFELKADKEKTLLFYSEFMRSTKNKSREQVIRSFHWFHKGFWEQIPSAKFLSYYVGFEQAITTRTNQSQSQKLGILLGSIPKITITWRQMTEGNRLSNVLCNLFR